MQKRFYESGSCVQKNCAILGVHPRQECLCYAQYVVAGGWVGRIQLRARRTDLVLMIRLSRIGKKKKPFYRVVVIEKTRPRNGRVVELVGTYDPLKKPALLSLDAERIKHWLGVGAQPSDTVRSFIRQQKIA